jgi:hypothetical protein
MENCNTTLFFPSQFIGGDIMEDVYVLYGLAKVGLSID